jgi:pyruvate dehydrogenase E1 component alpha subunit
MDNNSFLGSLGRLADPEAFHDNLEISGVSGLVLESLLLKMMFIRYAENHLAAARKEGLIGGPVHLGVGQEAIAVGVSRHLRSTDRVFGAHRSHAHYLALSGASLHKLFAEILGRSTGTSLGMGGSMHLWDKPIGFYGSVPIVAGTVSLAVGAGLAAKFQKTGDIAVVYLGDGAVEEGVVHESLNLARLYDIPIIFVVENNLFASHMHISKRQPSNSVGRFAAANSIPYEVIDGNDVLAVSSLTEKLVENARLGKGPALIEAVTHRWFGHVDWREDIDVGVNRSQKDLENWRARDPVVRLSSAMIEYGLLTDGELFKMEEELYTQIEEAWNQAIKDPYPKESVLLKCVYASADEVKNG